MKLRTSCARSEALRFRAANSGLLHHYALRNDEVLLNIIHHH